MSVVSSGRYSCAKTPRTPGVAASLATSAPASRSPAPLSTTSYSATVFASPSPAACSVLARSAHSVDTAHPAGVRSERGGVELHQVEGGRCRR
ncbi:hypothetical protein SMD20_40130 [Nonomuraea sp. LP-02]|uniref:hypothetical protein n=1 Tax=Nonomuraea sp. LP-02 TaxID=3097960 RepID=UPI002E35744C|nr:hypothetical protein [Nonomuraea sp. LP-02]MED7930490.1 hypothetical protein [Nonomuraea sp. LP-02]